MKNLWTVLLVAALGSLCASGAVRRPVITTSPIYINNSPVTTFDIPPQIDATAFLNRSIFDVLTTLPYQAQNVRYWTNNGTMDGIPGFDFQNVTDGAHLKKPNARRTIRDSRQLLIPSAMFVNNGNISGSGMLNVNATNIINPGRLEATEAAFIRINAPGYADLSRSGIRVGAAQATAANCGFFSVSSNFISDGNIVDLYWGGGRNNALGTNGQPLDLTTLTGGFSSSNFFSFLPTFNLPFPSSGQHEVIERFSGRNFTNVVSVPGFGFFNGTNFIGGGCGGPYTAYVHTNLNGNGVAINVVFVPTNSFVAPSNMFVDVFFTPNSGPAGQAYAPVVEFRNVDFDIVNQAFITNYVTLVDATAAQTNVALARPFATVTASGATAPTVTRRPWSYTWIRGRLCNIDNAFGLVDRANADFSPSMFYDPARFATNIVNTIYAADSVQVGQSNSQAFASSTPSIISGGPSGTIFRQLGVNPALSDPTNFAGNINISAHQLSLEGARLRAEDFIGIHTDNLVSNTVAAIDAPFIDFDVRTTNAVLLISNLAPASVSRLAGEISAWSAAWSVAVTNSNSTNTTNMRFHVLIVDNCLRSEQPVTLNRFIAHAPSLIINDNLFINASATLDTRALTVQTNGSLNLPSPSNLAFTNVLDLVNFTNYGVVNVPAAAYFGVFEAGHIPGPPKPRRPRRRKPVVEKPAPLDNFINHGTIAASSILVRGANVQDVGSVLSAANLTASGGVIIERGNTIVASNATLIASSDIEFHGNDVALASTFMSAGTFSNSVSGSNSTATFIKGAIVVDATNSFGDIEGTTTNDWFVTGGFRITERPNNPGDLMGTRIYSIAAPLVSSTFVWAGNDFGNTPEGYTHNLALGRLVLDGRGGNLFRFSSATRSNALYVDFLELLNDATNYNFAVGVDPDFTIYFADANVPPEKLNNISGGRLRWVSSFTGPQSSTNLVYPNGKTYTFNAGLVRSLDIDSDNDTIVNGLDCTPIPVPDLDTTLAQNNCPPPPLLAAVVKRATKAVAAESSDFGLSIALEANEAILSWSAPAASQNTVQYSDELNGGQWNTLTNFISGPVETRVAIRDAAGAPLRVYRVRVSAVTK